MTRPLLMRTPTGTTGQVQGKKMLGKREWSLTLTFIGVGAVIVVVIALMAVWAISQSKFYALKAADTTMTNLAGTLSLNIGNSVRQIDLGLLAVRDELSRQQKAGHRDDQQIIDTIAREDSRHPDSIGFRVFGSDGKLRYGVSNIVTREVDFSDNDEFKLAKAISSDELLVTPPFFGAVARQWLIVLVRRVSNPDGSFGGAVYSAIPVEHLIRIFSGLDLGPGGAVALYHTSFLLAARFPDIKVGTNTISEQLRAIIASGTQSAKFENLSPVDGTRRTGYALKVDGLPYYVSVAMAVDDFMLPWRRNRNNILIFAVSSSVILLGGLLLIYATFTRWRQVGAALAASEAKLRGLFDLCPIGIARNTLDGRFVEFNESFRDLTGYDASELTEIDYWALTPEKYRPDELIQMKSLLSYGRYGPYEKEYIRKDGSCVPLSLRGILVNDQDGSQYIWSLVEDITERKLASDSRAKSEFLMMMSHELRTPLNAVIGYAEMICMIRSDDSSAGQIKDYATNIRMAGEHLLAIINDILDISAVESGKLTLHMEEVDLGAVVAAAGGLIEPRAKEKNLRIDVDVAGASTIRLVSDAQRIKQILINLLGNAVKFTPEGGWVALRVAANDDGGVTMRISDNGIGMDAEGLAKALSMFGQVDSRLARKHQGTGLGLPLCKRLTEALGGRFEIESRLEQGTTITIDLPANPALTEVESAVL